VLKSFRLRITAWYLGFFSALAILFSLLLYGALAQALGARLDETIATESRTAASLFQSELFEWKGDEESAADETITELHPRDVFFAIYSNGRLLSTNTGAPPETLRDLERAIAAAPSGDPFAVRYTAAGGRAVAQDLEANAQRYRITAFTSLAGLNDQLAVARRVLGAGLPLLILAAGFGGYWIAARSIWPLQAMATQARAITDSNLNARLEIGRPAEELATLAGAFNELLSRLDGSFSAMRQFIADASHELRTPIAVIQGESEVALQRERSAAEYRDSLAVIHDESRRLARLVGDLLNLARADAGHARLQPREFYLNDMLADCCRSAQTMAAARGVAVECGACEDSQYLGDEELLRRMAMNLLDNAIRYTPAGGHVRVEVERNGAGVAIRVSDDGIGIPQEALPHVFDRFYRADGARSRNEGGFGLGLAIVKWIAESHQGSVEVSSAPGRGSVFTVHLPRPDGA
jgi:heavy metal sensor kinase